MRVEIKNHDAAKYVPKLPEDAEIVGKIVQRGNGGTGALVLLDTWEFVQITDGVQCDLDQKAVYTAIVNAIVDGYCDECVDLAIAAGSSLDTVWSWKSGRRTPTFGTIKLLLVNYGIIKRCIC